MKTSNLSADNFKKHSNSVGSITDYGEDPPKRDILFMLQVFERVGISLVEEREAKQFVISVKKKAQKG